MYRSLSSIFYLQLFGYLEYAFSFFLNKKTSVYCFNFLSAFYFEPFFLAFLLG
ncbi:hypothetical protein DB43_HK00380 [Parachlamydia acanthamoebae]|uniref:Uncharacterized protein n=1 Tax=Parachlamydia acanthamoebae TaxID=83552 RepID=A0A0C1C6K1_9BACT|nr:hypothetical protein DB43_HK00380 [Parachlamydia acanthamoebae]